MYFDVAEDCCVPVLYHASLPSCVATARSGREDGASDITAVFPVTGSEEGSKAKRMFHGNMEAMDVSNQTTDSTRKTHRVEFVLRNSVSAVSFFFATQSEPFQRRNSFQGGSPWALKIWPSSSRPIRPRRWPLFIGLVRKMVDGPGGFETPIPPFNRHANH